MLSEFEMGEVLFRMMGAYPSFAPKVAISDLVKTYYHVLADLPAMAVRRGAAQVMGVCKFFPSAFELRSEAVNCWHLLGRRAMCDADQRIQDEMYGFAPALLTKGNDQWSPGEVEEFTRLVGKAPWRA